MNICGAVDIIMTLQAMSPVPGMQTAAWSPRDYTLIMETEMGTKEWLKDNSTKETKGVQNRDKVIMKDQEIESYGVGSELLDEFNSRVLSATVVDKNKRKIATCKKE